MSTTLLILGTLTSTRKWEQIKYFKTATIITNGIKSGPEPRRKIHPPPIKKNLDPLPPTHPHIFQPRPKSLIFSEIQPSSPTQPSAESFKFFTSFQLETKKYEYKNTNYIHKNMNIMYTSALTINKLKNK